MNLFTGLRKGQNFPNATKILSCSSNKRVANCCAFKNQEDLQYTLKVQKKCHLREVIRSVYLED